MLSQKRLTWVVLILSLIQALLIIHPIEAIAFPKNTNHFNNHERSVARTICLDDSDCLPLYTQNCQNFTCRSGVCIQADYYCPPTTQVCTVDPGVCSLLDNICYYPQWECDDGDVCTNDYCALDPGDNISSTCMYVPIPNCVSNVHQASIRIVDVNVLDVYPIPGTEDVQFCHISTYQGPDSAVLLSFTPYENCTLPERGTCDNRYASPESIPAQCVTKAASGSFPCNSPYSPYPIAIPGLSLLFDWVSVPLPAVHIYDTNTQTIHIHGYIEASDLPGMTLKVDMWFTDAIQPIPSPSLPMNPLCYTSFPSINVSTWVGYQYMNGVLQAVPGTDYEGLHIELLSTPIIAQTGYAANGINNQFGLLGFFNWEIVSQPYNNDFVIEHTESVVNVTLDIGGLCTDTNSYCDLFGEPQEAPGNGWQVTLDIEGNLITYCRNFTVEDLLACHNYTDSHSALFTYVNTVNDVVIYSGQLYATTLVPTTCPWEGDNCGGEMVATSAAYNVTISINTLGESSIQFATSYTDFAVYWINNVWMCGPEDGGNLKVNIKTRIRDDDNFPDARLCNPQIDTDQETGYPLVFVEPLDPPCQMIGDYCYQTWVLRTFDGNNVVDFSGYKPMKFDVCDFTLVTGRVSAAMDLFAIHVGDQSHVSEGDVAGELQIYNDRQFTELHDSEEILLDGQKLYGLLCLTNHFHLDVHIKRVYVCYSTEGDIIPFDPLSPSDTGCNTPDIDVMQKLIYSSEYADTPLLTNPHWYQYEQLFNPPTTADCEGFSFLVHASTPYTQSIQIVWCAQENGGAGATIEMITETHFKNHDLQLSRHLTDQSTDDSLFSVACSSEHFEFDEDYFRCRLVHHSDDDDEDEMDDGLEHAWLLLILLLFIGLVAFLIWLHYRPKRLWEESTLVVVKSKEKPSPPSTPPPQPKPQVRRPNFQNLNFRLKPSIPKLN